MCETPLNNDHPRCSPPDAIVMVGISRSPFPSIVRYETGTGEVREQMDVGFDGIVLNG